MAEPKGGGTGPPRRVGVREFRGNITTFLREAQRGATILVTSRDKVVAELRPPPAAHRPPRQPGALRGVAEGAIFVSQHRGLARYEVRVLVPSAAPPPP